MIFNSLEFFLFFPLTLLAYAIVINRSNLRHGVLLIASYIFYMSSYWEYAGLIAFSTLADYLISNRMGKTDNRNLRKLLLFASLILNLGLLATFKYFNFFVDLATDTLTLGGFDIDLTLLRHDLLLPVGISFYTFQTLGYTIDVYRREIKPEGNLVKFALFVSFFPQLVAGPIVRAKEFLPQFDRAPIITRARFDEGLSLVFYGLFKKVIIADTLATLGVDAVFANPENYSSFDLLMALYAYTFQIYCDFSGYSDIAIGIAMMMGFRLPENFNRPYLSSNIREFWSRWHISLSSWLRDYLYIALGGNRGTRFATARNLMITMLLGGLWHGAGMNFVLWGLYHGLLLVFHHSVSKPRNKPSIIGKLRNQFLTFHAVVFGWLLFRVEDMEQFSRYLAGLADFKMDTQLSGLFFVILGLAVVTHLLPTNWFSRLTSAEKVPVYVSHAGYAALLLLFWGASVGSTNFIYFQF